MNEEGRAFHKTRQKEQMGGSRNAMDEEERPVKQSINRRREFKDMTGKE